MYKDILWIIKIFFRIKYYSLINEKRSESEIRIQRGLNKNIIYIKETNIFKKTSHLQMNLEVKSYLNTRKCKEKGMQKN